MYHSITFGEKNTWDDWHLIPKSRPLFLPPETKTNTVDIPGGNGSLDLTTALAGHPLYKNRSGTVNFYVENGFKEWHVLYSEIMSYLHGKRMKAILEDDPRYYYEGRFFVSKWTSDSNYSTISIKYDVAPYKKSLVAAGDDWEWDPFNFELDSITSFEAMEVDGTLGVNIEGGDMAAAPTIYASAAGMTVTYNGTTYDLNKGTNYISGLELQTGTNTLTFNGTGSVTIKYTKGRL